MQVMPWMGDRGKVLYFVDTLVLLISLRFKVDRCVEDGW